MKKKKRKNGLLIAVLALALVAVLAVIAYQYAQYAAGTAYYDGLRGMGDAP